MTEEIIEEAISEGYLKEATAIVTTYENDSMVESEKYKSLQGYFIVQQADELIGNGDIEAANKLLFQNESNDIVADSDAKKYIEAYDLYENDQYEEAKEAFKKIKGYCDAEDKMWLANYPVAFNENYKIGSANAYRACEQLLKNWKQKDAKKAERFISENKNDWRDRYDKLGNVDDKMALARLFVL